VFNVAARAPRRRAAPRHCAPPLLRDVRADPFWPLRVLSTQVVFLLPTEAHLDEVAFGSVQASVPVGAALIALGIIGPCACIRACVWWRSPSESQRMKSASFGDSLLQEMLDGRNIMEHLTVYGAGNGEAGTIIMLPGAAAPRGTLAPVAALVADRFRVICVDLPGQGSLSAVPYSLARCEMVLTLVVRRAQVGSPGRRVVIVAQGAAAFVASHFALRQSSGKLTAGLVVMGRVPDYVGAARCSCSLDSVYSLPWAAVFANRAFKARIAASDWRPADRRVAGQSDFNLAAIPQMRAELRGRPLLHRLREFERNIVFLGPRAWVEEAEELVPVRRVQARRVRGARDDTLPPVDGASVEAMAAEVIDVRAAAVPAPRCPSAPAVPRQVPAIPEAPLPCRAHRPCPTGAAAALRLPRSSRPRCLRITGRWRSRWATTSPSPCPGRPSGDPSRGAARARRCRRAAAAPRRSRAGGARSQTSAGRTEPRRARRRLRYRGMGVRACVRDGGRDGAVRGIALPRSHNTTFAAGGWADAPFDPGGVPRGRRRVDPDVTARARPGRPRRRGQPGEP